MYTANEVDAILVELKQQVVSRPDIIRRLSDACLGWPYVFGASGELCTPETRRRYAGIRPDHAEAIKSACPVLSGKQTSCAGCKWNGCRCFDCRGFTRWLLSLVGLNLYGATVTTQWESSGNWVKKGNIADMPRNLVCCVFREGHTGVYVGDDLTRHCGGKKGQVVEEPLPGNPKWLRYGIPSGLYSNEELRKAGVDFDESKNIPTLRRGSVGDEVEELQVLLNAKYGFNLDVDGVFGAKTEAAVKEFQKGNKLTADGVVGQKTRRALGLSSESLPFGGDEPSMTASGGNLIGGEIIRNEQSPQWGAATIEDAELSAEPTDEVTPPATSAEISNAHIIWDRLMRAIGNPYGVAGLMGNLQAESGMNPENLQNTGNRALGLSDAEYTAAVGTGKYTAEQFIHDGYGYGLAQWTYYSRKANLLNFAVGKGCSIGDLDTQIEFLLDEIRYSYPQVWNMLVSTPYIREASDAVMLKYEKPANTSEENQIRRAELGQKYFDQFADVGKTSDPGPMDGPVGDPAEWDDEEAADGVWMPRLKLLEIQAALSDCLGIIKNALEGD